MSQRDLDFSCIEKVRWYSLVRMSPPPTKSLWKKWLEAMKSKMAGATKGNLFLSDNKNDIFEPLDGVRLRESGEQTS